MAMTQSSFAPRPPHSSSLPFPALTSPSSSWSPPRHGPRRRRALTAASSLHLGPEDFAELAHNKVLIAATVASLIGQLAKPFTSGRDEGKIDIIRLAARSGGMPSTHSATYLGESRYQGRTRLHRDLSYQNWMEENSWILHLSYIIYILTYAVVAVTTSLALERGFADSIFGMSVVFASIVMYDAQGVRREVGKHARLLKKLWALRHQKTQDQEEGGDLVNSTSEPLPVNREMASVPQDASTSQRSNTMPFPRHSAATTLPGSNALRSSELDLTELTEEYNRLSESVGHTEAQVTVGALLGFVVSLAIHATL